MAPNFKILIHSNCDNLHLKLMGEFDGSSAHELINVLKRHCRRTSRVFIHTSALKHIHPFGQNVFQNNLDVVYGQSLPLVFTGENAAQLAPKGCKIC